MSKIMDELKQGWEDLKADFRGEEPADVTEPSETQFKPIDVYDEAETVETITGNTDAPLDTINDYVHPRHAADEEVVVEAEPVPDLSEELAAAEVPEIPETFDETISTDVNGIEHTITYDSGEHGVCYIDENGPEKKALAELEEQLNDALLAKMPTDAQLNALREKISQIQNVRTRKLAGSQNDVRDQLKAIKADADAEIARIKQEAIDKINAVEASLKNNPDVEIESIETLTTADFAPLYQEADDIVSDDNLNTLYAQTQSVQSDADHKREDADKAAYAAKANAQDQFSRTYSVLKEQKQNAEDDAADKMNANKSAAQKMKDDAAKEADEKIALAQKIIDDAKAKAAEINEKADDLIAQSEQTNKAEIDRIANDFDQKVKEADDAQQKIFDDADRLANDAKCHADYVREMSKKVYEEAAKKAKAIREQAEANIEALHKEARDYETNIRTDEDNLYNETVKLAENLKDDLK